jgi:hypothetical protein
MRVCTEQPDLRMAASLRQAQGKLFDCAAKNAAPLRMLALWMEQENAIHVRSQYIPADVPLVLPDQAAAVSSCR